MRINSLQEKMRKEEITAALLLYHRDVLYYAGTAQPCNLLIPADGEPALFVRRAMNFVKKETHLDNIYSATGLKKVSEKLHELYPGGGRLGVEEDVLPAALYNRIRKAFPGFEPVDITPHILRQRAVKDAGEQAKIKETAKIFEEVHKAVTENLVPGITEIELAAEIYRRVRRAGGEFITHHRRWDNTSTHEGLIACSSTAWKISGMAMTVTGIGTGSSMPWGASPAEIGKGDLLVVDIGINSGGYHVDIARTYVAGQADELQKERFNVVNEIMKTVLAAALPGIPAEELFLLAERKAEELGVIDYFQGWGDMKGHYIGHGVGLEIDDEPMLIRGNKEPLQEGMVVSIEPKLIIPEWGAVDLEDTVIIHEKEPEVLTPVPRQLFEVYS